MKLGGPARGPSCVCRLAFSAVMIGSFCAWQARSQDAAEVARQEKARKAAEQRTPQHVYTDDDLRRKVILTPEDQARVEARKKQQNSAPSEQDASAKPQPPAATATESLGEIARRYRREKAEREAALAEKKKFAPFPYNVPKDVLAEPKTGAAPLTGALPGLMERRAGLAPGVHSAPKSYPPVAHDHQGRISPFEPRPLIGSPVVTPPAIAVVPSKPVRPIAPVRGTEGRVMATNPAGSALKSVQVVRGQSWWKLAETYLGSGARWPELRQLNAHAGGPPELLKLGGVVVVPANAAFVKASSRTITVSKGDSLWSLAQQNLGRGSAWTCLASANPQISDYTHLAIGAILQLPTGGQPSCQQNLVDLVRK